MAKLCPKIIKGPATKGVVKTNRQLDSDKVHKLQALGFPLAEAIVTVWSGEMAILLPLALVA